MSYDQIIRELHVRANAVNVAAMARFGINPDNTLGVSVRELRGMAKGLGRNHDLALRLWE
jgi:3-methyladenine DNA glycosylase AlkD